MLLIIRKKLRQFFVLECLYVFIFTLKDVGLDAAIRAVRVLKMNKVTCKDYMMLEDILTANAGKQIIVFLPFINWNIPLYQRPQHIALNLASEGFLYFFCTDNSHYDEVVGFEKIASNCYLTNRYEMLEKMPRKKILHLCSTDNRTGVEIVLAELQKGNLILYEYIDEIDGSLGGITIPESTYQRHDYILKDERCIVIATADKLFREVLKYRSANCALVTNGVEYQHFAHKFSREDASDEIHPLLAKEKPVIGYFGALASWFDYDLIIKIANERPQYEILLIGWDYDNSSKQYELDKFPNITVCGPIKYNDLPRYACWFDVATIPFKINDITEATSPIKLFEYMAMGHPIVTTGLPECRKYQSVLIGEGHDDFMAKLDYALTLRDHVAYKALLKKEALENTWEAKARVIVDLIKVNIG